MPKQPSDTSGKKPPAPIDQVRMGRKASTSRLTLSRAVSNSPMLTSHAGREKRPTLSAGQILILRLPLTVGPFFCFFFPLGLCTIPLPRCPLGDIVDLG